MPRQTQSAGTPDRLGRDVSKLGEPAIGRYARREWSSVAAATWPSVHGVMEPAEQGLTQLHSGQGGKGLQGRPFWARASDRRPAGIMEYQGATTRRREVRRQKSRGTREEKAGGRKAGREERVQGKQRGLERGTRPLRPCVLRSLRLQPNGPHSAAIASSIRCGRRPGA